MPRRHRNLFTLAFLGLAFLFASNAWSQPATAAAATTPRYRNPKLTIGERVADLLSRMTLEEKVDEICGGENRNLSLLDTTGTYRPDQASAVLRDLYNEDSKDTPRQGAIIRNAVQRYLREKTPLGIPVAVHGRSAARFHEQRQHQLSASAGTGQHLGSGAGAPRLHRRRR